MWHQRNIVWVCSYITSWIKEEKNSPEPLGENIPGVQNVYVKTWGCAHNSSDSEYMAGQLSAYGYNLTDDRAKADLWLLNSCTVKNPAEDHFRWVIIHIRQKSQ